MGLILFPDYDFEYVPIEDLSFDDTFLYYEEPYILPALNYYEYENVFFVKLIDGGKVRFISIDRAVLKLKIDMHCIGDPVKTEYGSLEPGSVFKYYPNDNIVYMKLVNYDDFPNDIICLNTPKEMYEYIIPPIKDDCIVYKYTNVKLKGFIERTHKTSLSKLNPGDIFISNNGIFMYIMEYEDYYYLLDIKNHYIFFRTYDIGCLKISDAKFSDCKTRTCCNFSILRDGNTFVTSTNPDDPIYGIPHMKVPAFSINGHKFNAIDLTDGKPYYIYDFVVVIHKDFYVK